MQLEKLLQKNYFLHQSARDGFRSYLQAYASYSLKKIFDVNQLDLAKVGKAFGFAVPPRVNVNIGQGTGGAGHSGKKRRRDEDEEENEVEEHWEEIDAKDKDENDLPEEQEESRKNVRRNGKGRRTETLGKRRVEKEVYKKGLERKKMKGEGGAQWSR
jgi:ATP-dependent RNA helicase DDX18/HAS1